MDRRKQKLIYGRIQSLFPATETTDVRERGMRLLEEAGEAAQAMQVSLLDAVRILSRVYSRPMGDPQEELGQVLLVLAAAGEAIDVDVESLGEKALNTILRPSPERLTKWAINERDKLAAGIAVPRGHGNTEGD